MSSIVQPDPDSNSPETCRRCGHQREDHMPPGRTDCMETLCRCRLYRTSEPPTEAREDDETEILLFLSDLYGPGHAWQLPGQSRQDLTDANVARVRAFLAARTAADTETLPNEVRTRLEVIADEADHFDFPGLARQIREVARG